MWGKQNPTRQMYFAVARYDFAQQTSLLEVELEYFFYHQHNLKNMKVLGIPTKPEEALSRLLKEVTTRSPGSWVVDELITPGSWKDEQMTKIHQQWTKELQQLQRQVEVQTDDPLLWIACAGIDCGKAEHFTWAYLNTLLPPVFHLPQMEVPLRNTKQVLELAELQ